MATIEKAPVVPQSVQVFGRKKTATAVAFAKKGKGFIKVFTSNVKIKILILEFEGEWPTTGIFATGHFAYEAPRAVAGCWQRQICWH